MAENNTGAEEAIKGVVEDAKGKTKEAAAIVAIGAFDQSGMAVVGKVTGRDDLHREGQAQQDKAEAERDAAKKEAESARRAAKASEEREKAEQ